MREYTEGNIAPIVVDFLIACQSIDPMECIGEITWNSTAGKSARDFLFHHELIDDIPRITDRGRAWLKLILETPLPVQAWIDPRKERD